MCAARLFNQKKWREEYTPNKRSLGKLEAKKARNYCYQHSKVTRKDENGDPQEIVFLGTNEEMQGYVLAKVKTVRTGDLMEVPKATVLSNHYGGGFFDQPDIQVLLSGGEK